MRIVFSVFLLLVIFTLFNFPLFGQNIVQLKKSHEFYNKKSEEFKYSLIKVNHLNNEKIIYICESNVEQSAWFHTDLITVLNKDGNVEIEDLPISKYVPSAARIISNSDYVVIFVKSVDRKTSIEKLSLVFFNPNNNSVKVEVDLPIDLENHVVFFCAFDEDGNFNIIMRDIVNMIYFKLNKADNFSISERYDISGDDYSSQVYGRPTSKEHYYGSIDFCELSLCRNNKLMNLYFMKKFIEVNGNTRLIDDYRKIGVTIFDKEKKTFEKQKVYDIDDIYSERYKNVYYYGMKLIKPINSDLPVLYATQTDTNNIYLSTIHLAKNTLLPTNKQKGQKTTLETREGIYEDAWYFDTGFKKEQNEYGTWNTISLDPQLIGVSPEGKINTKLFPEAEYIIPVWKLPTWNRLQNQTKKLH